MDSTDLARTSWPPIDPRQLLYGAAGAAVAAWAVSWLPGDFFILMRVLVVLAGLIAAGAALALRPKWPSGIAAAGAIAWACRWALDPAWDTARLLLDVTAGIAFLAAFLVGLPWLMGWAFVAFHYSDPDGGEHTREQGQAVGQVTAKVVFSLLIVLHFTGIGSAIMNTASGGNNASWLAGQTWMTYRPYLEFFYLNNAYKFYSPEPGPASMLWYRVEYADGSARWIKVPNRKEHAPDPLAQEYTRRLTLAEAIRPAPVLMISEKIKQSRASALLVHGIDYHPYQSINAQYLPVEEFSRRLLKEYAKHVARSYPSETDPGLEVAGVKIYRVVHDMLDPGQMLDRSSDPAGEWTFRPYFMGEFTKDGVLKDPNDPLLYWLIPIFRVPTGWKPNLLRPLDIVDQEPEYGLDYEVKNYLEKHAALRTQEGKR